MITRIAFITLIVASLSGLYVFENSINIFLEPDNRNINFIGAFILFIGFVTGIIGLLLSLIRKDESLKQTKVMERPKVKTKNQETISDDLIMLLSLLQEEGRFLDFLSEEISSYSDAQVASAGRIVHRGCSTVLKKYFELSPILESESNSSIDKPENIPTSHLKIHGKETKKIKVIHKGWQLNSANLPKKITNNASNKKVITPAEADSVE